MRTNASALGMRVISLKPRKSMIPQPTVIRMPASTDRGTYFTRLPKPKSMARRKRACTIPDIWVLPPDFTFTTVRMVAPAPEIPQNSPATALPMP